MPRRFYSKGPRRAEEPRMAFITSSLAGHHIPRVQLKSDAELFNRFPKGPVFALVVVSHRIRTADLRETAHERSAKAELGHASRQLSRGSIGILHGQSRESMKTRRIFPHLLRQKIIRTL